MAWTAPKTNFNAGDILTAAEMNAIGQNLLSLINIKQTTLTSTLSDSTTGSWTQAMSVSITPTSATSKILVIASIQCGGTSAARTFLRLMRGSTPIAVGDAAGSRTQVSGMAYANANYDISVTVPWLDSPATTSATTYAVEFMPSSNNAVYINRTQGDGNNAEEGRAVSTLTAIEVPI